MSSHFHSARQQFGDGRFGGIANFMALVHCQVAIHLEMKLNEDTVAGVSGAQVVHVTHAGTGKNPIPDPPTLRAGQFSV